jgi:hypothetical protein
VPILSKKCHFKPEKVFEKVFEKSESGLKKVSLETIAEEEEEQEQQQEELS